MFRYILLVCIFAFSTQLAFAENEATENQISYDSILEVRKNYNLKCPPPKYPSAAIRNGQQGSAEVKVDVNADGKVTSVSLLTSSKYPLLDRASIETYEQCAFQPKTSEIQIPFTFRTKVEWRVAR